MNPVCQFTSFLKGEYLCLLIDTSNSFSCSHLVKRRIDSTFVFHRYVSVFFFFFFFGITNIILCEIPHRLG